MERAVTRLDVTDLALHNKRQVLFNAHTQPHGVVDAASPFAIAKLQWQELIQTLQSTGEGVTTTVQRFDLEHAVQPSQRTDDAEYNDAEAFYQYVSSNPRMNELVILNGAAIKPLGDVDSLVSLFASSPASVMRLSFAFQSSDPQFINARTPSSVCEAAFRHPAVTQFADAHPEFADASVRDVSIFAWKDEMQSVHVEFCAISNEYLTIADMFVEDATIDADSVTWWNNLRATISQNPTTANSTLRTSAMRLLSGRRQGASTNEPYRAAWMNSATRIPDVIFPLISDAIGSDSRIPYPVQSQAAPNMLLNNGHSLRFTNSASGQTIDYNVQRTAYWRDLLEWIEDQSNEFRIRIDLTLRELDAQAHVGRFDNSRSNALVSFYDAMGIDYYVDLNFAYGDLVIPDEAYEDDDYEDGDDMEEPKIDKFLNRVTATQPDWNMLRVSFEMAEIENRDDEDEMQLALQEALDSELFREFAQRFRAVALATNAQCSAVVRLEGERQLRVDFCFYSQPFIEACKEFRNSRSLYAQARNVWRSVRNEHRVELQSRKRRASQDSSHSSTRARQM